MIALWVAAAMVFERVEAGTDEVSIQAMIPFDEKDTVDPAVLETLVKLLPTTIEGYSRKDVMNITAGVPMECELEPDHIRLALSVPPQNLAAGIRLLDAVLHHSKMADDTIREALTKRERGNYWSTALRPFDADYTAIRPQDVLEAYRRLGDPNKIRLAIGGQFEEGKPTELWQGFVDGWVATRLPPRVSYQPKVKFRTSTPEGVSMIQLAGPEFPAKAADFSTRFLAMVALGTGKGASLFRAVRGETAISYRQEALLVPTVKGWEPRLAVASKRESGDELEVAEAVRATLLKDIESWGEPDRLRAVGMADTVLTRMPELSPLALWRNGTVSRDLEGRTFLAAYWPMKTGNPWNPEMLADSASAVRLDELKEAAREIVAKATVRIVPGAG